jgi:hypothetical protein
MRHLAPCALVSEVGVKSHPGPVGKSSGPSRRSLCVNEWPSSAEASAGKRVARKRQNSADKQGEKRFEEFLVFGVALRRE